MKARTVQQLFNAVIDGGFYSERYFELGEPFPPSEWMCCAVTSAVKANCVTAEEAGKIDRAINQYLHSMYIAAGTLATALRRNDLPANFNDRLAIYRDWKNRPRKVK